MKTYEQLEAAAQRLKRTERGQRALEALSQFASDGGTGLDTGNKQAAADLFMACLDNPWNLPAWFTQGKAVAR